MRNKTFKLVAYVPETGVGTVGDCAHCLFQSREVTDISLYK
jgi:hypothetical protein